jgi:hypothetical protein
MGVLRSILSRVTPTWVHRARAACAKKRLEVTLPAYAKQLIDADESGALGPDLGPELCIENGVEWLCRAQSCSSTNDGGVARHFSLIDGWAPSYPETTGYIVPTLLEQGTKHNREDWVQSARKMLDWLLAIQFPEGGFQGGMIGQVPRVPVTFNTGQILLGLAAGARHFKDAKYLNAMRRAASWLVETQDRDGCWRHYGTPFAAPGEKAYETHVAWGLFEADRVDGIKGFGEAGLRQVEWALSCQRGNGWFDKCCLSDNDRPLTHTIGYVLRGILEAYKWRPTQKLLHASEATGAALLQCINDNGSIPSRLDCHWRAAASDVCLTGNVQIAHCWFILFQMTKESRYLTAARLANQFVRRTIPVGQQKDIDGGVRGSYPVTGNYGRYEFLNWAAKFMVDANSLELELQQNRLT